MIKKHWLNWAKEQENSENAWILLATGPKKAIHRSPAE